MRAEVGLSRQYTLELDDEELSVLLNALEHVKNHDPSMAVGGLSRTDLDTTVPRMYVVLNDIAIAGEKLGIG